ncbi:SDR family NAD(P)-dependent oxidoreductase [Brevibacterium sp. FAM 24638]|uniref:SDR family NAD(P)-dependent oxidoreductase n=1 Tax=Brevibacterium sp. FAM 24638 TaxID=3415681 RepID=UPI003C7AC5E3
MNKTDKMTVVISGGASGIGYATAKTLASRGNRLVLVDLDQEKVDQAVEELEGEGHIGISADVTSTDSIGSAFETIRRSFGHLDGVVAAAGIVDPSPSESVSDESLERLIDIHLLGSIRMARAAYPLLCDSAKASIVCLSSMGARLGVPQRLGYNVAKSGIEGMVRTLAVEWVRQGIRVNAVAPGWVKTPAIANLIDSGFLDPTPVEERTPLGRFAEPTEIAEAIAFLLSPTSSYITGQSLTIDGGMTIHFPQ